MNRFELQKKHLLTVEFFTGVFCLGALAILFYFTVMIRGKDYFFPKEQYELQASFPHAGALAVNDKVKVIGVDMGKVKTISLAADNNSIVVTMMLYHPVTVNCDYVVTIQNSSVFGGAYVNIVPGTDHSNPVSAGTMLKGKPPVDIINEASELISQLKDDEARLRKALLDDGFMEDMRHAITSIESNSKNFNRICDDILAGKGTLGKMFVDETLYHNADSSFEKISRTTDSMNTLLKDMREGPGTFARMLKDDSMYKSMNDSMNAITTLCGRVTESDGSFSRFLNDNGKLYNSLENALDNLDSFSRDLRSGKGTLGKIVSDESLYVELKDAVAQLRAAIEDFREMAPVATFGSIALGAL